MHETVRIPANKTRTSGAVLLIEDEEAVGRSLARMMGVEGYHVTHVTTASAAIERVMNGSFDVVISDLNLAGASGVDVLNVVRAYDPDVPLVLLTGCPSIDTAIEAVSLGVLEYVLKPASREQIVSVLARATALRKATNAREALAATVPPSKLTATCPSMRATFDRALASLTVELEPVVDSTTKSVVGFAARMSSSEEALRAEAALVVAADRLGMLPALRRRARDLAVAAFEGSPPGTLLFVDVHPSDLLDGDLYSSDPPLARVADRIVLQVSGRAAALAVEDFSARASVLRFVGFKIAITDLDESQASLSQIADVSPEYVKIDQRLVRGIERAPARQRVVAAVASMCKALDATAIAEGVSTAEERETLLGAGCHLVQGSLVARHAPTSMRKPPSNRADRHA